MGPDISTECPQGPFPVLIPGDLGGKYWGKKNETIAMVITNDD